MWFRLCLLLALLHVNAPSAQPSKYDPGTDEKRIETGLRSVVPLEVAWAAWRTRFAPSKRWDQPLREALQVAVASQQTKEQELLIRFLLDTLIRSHTPVPVSELLPLYEAYPDAILALIAQGSDHNDGQLLPLLIRAEREDNASRWMLIASLLSRERSRAFEEHLLDELRIEISIDIVEGQHLPVFLPDRSGVIGGIVGSSPAPADWPDLPAVYCLAVTPEPGDSVIITNPEAVYLRRYLADQNTCFHGWKTSRSHLSLSYLTNLIPRASGTYLPPLNLEKLTLVWQGAEETRRILQESAQEYIQYCRLLMAARQQARKATRSWNDAEMRSRIVLSVSDKRQDKSVALPYAGEMVRLAGNP
jgi:hypothetical protein